ncbi:MAG: phosphoadenylyl-sulfate reductase [Betaproteobacteria bacterium]
MSLEEKIGAVAGVLAVAAREFSPAALASSFGAEDMVLTDLIATRQPDIEIFTLDTGRLPEETHRLIGRAAQRYGAIFHVYHPEGSALESYHRANGANPFLRSVELRKRCCEIRKVLPLQRALAGKRAWITGLRRDQSASRQQVAVSLADAEFGLQKFNPLADWTSKDVWEYLRRFDVPYNELHDRGYPSIGCAPCTRAIATGEDPRAGRWWWEQEGGKECGLHEGRRARAAALNTA